MQTLETERLFLRDWRESDLDDLFEYACNPNVGPNAGWGPHAGKGESLRILHSFQESQDTWAIQVKENEKVIGSISLMADKFYPPETGKAKMLGYAMSFDYWGRGLMTEAARRVLKFAFEEAGLDFVTCSHFPFNSRSKRVIEKCGFRYEQTRSESFTNYRGEKLNELCYIITRDNYFSNIK